MALPKYILLSRKLLTEKPVAVNNALRLFHLGVVLVACDKDAVLGKTLADNVAIAQKPMVLIADFPESFRVINDDGSVEELEHGEDEVTETPILMDMN